LGASLANPAKLYFMVVGDLAFFYDLNSLGNRHVGKNLRIIVVNNGKGTEFRQYNHTVAHFGEKADEFISAAGHFGNKSKTLIKNYSESLGFEYFAASNKDEYINVCAEFLSPERKNKSLILEVFTDSDNESDALKLMRTIRADNKQLLKEKAKNVVGKKNIERLKGLLKR
jgi:2-succinyl-5-enolpyruvyl-6-hydroxy-3-cyclohexene-1-carboxylate synthase